MGDDNRSVLEGLWRAMNDGDLKAAPQCGTRIESRAGVVAQRHPPHRNRICSRAVAAEKLEAISGNRSRAEVHVL